jgi:hypothetical protein
MRDKRASWALMFIARSRSRVLPALRRPALLHSAIVHAHVGSLRELSPQQRSERFDSCFDRVDAHPHRVTGGDAQADLASHEWLPVFELARVVTDDVGVSDPGGGLDLDPRPRLHL